MINVVNIERNKEVRERLHKFFNEYGVAKKFFAGVAEMDYNLFSKWLNSKKNYVDANLDKIEMVLEVKYGQFR